MSWYQMTKRSRRCSYCETPWPIHVAFEICPTCQEETAEHHTEAIDPDVAADMSRHSRFGWFLVNLWLAAKIDSTASDQAR